jgi:hypothetical protein
MLIYIKTAAVAGGITSLLYFVWLTVGLFTSKSSTTGLWPFFAPITSYWFWLIVVAASGAYFRLAR